MPATRAAGDRLGIDGSGRLQPGAPADILLYRRDPTLAIDNLASLEAVIAAGRLYRVADLKRALQSSQAYFNSPLIRWRGAAPSVRWRGRFRGLDPGHV